MFTKKQVTTVSNIVLKKNMNFNGFKIMRLKDFLKLFDDQIDDLFCLKNRNRTSPYDILCLVDVDDCVNHTMSPDRTKKLQNAGGAKRRKTKEKYHYVNVFNRIHGYIILEDQKNDNIPRNKKVMSLSLICSSYYSNKRGVGSILMDCMIKLGKESGYTDIILEVANEHTGSEDDSSEEDEEYELSSEGTGEYDYGEVPDMELINYDIVEKISKEFFRKILRINGGVAYYNIDDDYISDIIHSYMNDEYDFEDYSDRFINFDIEEPGENDYGGFWYIKGKNSQKKLFDFYEKFGFVEDGRINYEWKAFTTNPFPSMVLSL